MRVEQMTRSPGALARRACQARLPRLRGKVQAEDGCNARAERPLQPPAECYQRRRKVTVNQCQTLSLAETHTRSSAQLGVPAYSDQLICIGDTSSAAVCIESHTHRLIVSQ